MYRSFWYYNVVPSFWWSNMKAILFTRYLYLYFPLFFIANIHIWVHTYTLGIIRRKLNLARLLRWYWLHTKKEEAHKTLKKNSRLNCTCFHEFGIETQCEVLHIFHVITFNSQLIGKEIHFNYSLERQQSTA